MTEGTMKMIKFLLGFFNLIIFCFSILLIALGLNIMQKFVSLEGMNFNIERLPTTFFVVIGCIFFFISFLGCYGSFAGNQCMLITYAATISVFFFIQLLITGLMISYRQDLESAVISHLHQEIAEHNKSDEFSINLLNTIQKSFICCGIDKPTDWKIESSPEKYLPSSCCYNEKIDGLEVTNHCAQGSWYSTKGCKEKVYETLQKNTTLLLTALIVFYLVQMTSIIFAYCLSCSQARNYDSI